jgi:hypothetical protein
MTTEQHPDQSESQPPHLPNLEPLKAGKIFATLLKTPAIVADAIAGGQDCWRSGLVLLGGAVIFHAIFGFSSGFFGGWSVAFMAMIKAPLVALCSLMLCLPSLYVFGCVGGAALTMSQAFMLGCTCQAMIGLLLIGLAPVSWLFSISTENLPFVVVLNLVLWSISLAFATKFVQRISDAPGFKQSSGISIWFIVFVLVSLQMSTAFRPLLTAPEPGNGWFTSEKKFFLKHFSSTFEPQSHYRRPPINQSLTPRR